MVTVYKPLMIRALVWGSDRKTRKSYHGNSIRGEVWSIRKERDYDKNINESEPIQELSGRDRQQTKNCRRHNYQKVIEIQEKRENSISLKAFHKLFESFRYIALSLSKRVLSTYFLSMMEEQRLDDRTKERRSATSCSYRTKAKERKTVFGKPSLSNQKRCVRTSTGDHTYYLVRKLELKSKR